MYNHPKMKGLAKPADATNRSRGYTASLVINIEGKFFGVTKWCHYIVAFETTELGSIEPVSIQESLPQLREMIANVEKENGICKLELPYILIKALW